MITVAKLTDPNSAFFDTICNWMFGWWGIRDGWDMPKMQSFMKRMMCEDRIPQTYIATNGEQIFGMYNLSMEDLATRPDVYPWLENVYVDEKFRGQGISRILLNSVADNARALGLSKLYLYTKHTNLYERYGWRFVEDVETFENPHIQQLFTLDL